MNNFIIKHASLCLFINGYDGDVLDAYRRNDMRRDNDAQNPYTYFKDKIIISKDKLRRMGYDSGSIKFKLSDKSEGSRQDLVNTYTYTVVEYDSVSYELELEDFEISPVEYM